MLPSPHNQSVHSPSTWRLQLLHLSEKKQLNIASVLSSTDRNMILLISDQTKTGRGDGILKIGPTFGSVMNESECLKNICHPHIVSFRDSFVLGTETICLHMERVPGESLIEIIVREGRLKENEVQEIYKQISQALVYLHKKGITHRDVKPDNIMWDRKSRTAKLIDFEFAGESSQRKKYRGGTTEYQPPEVLDLYHPKKAFTKKKVYSDQAIDVWSFGVSLFVSLTGLYPYNHHELTWLKDQTPTSLVLPSVSDVSFECKQLVNSLLTFDYKLRPSMTEVSQNPWLFVVDSACHQNQANLPKQEKKSTSRLSKYLKSFL